MSLIEKLIAEAQASNIVLYIKDDKLAFVAERGTFPQGLKERIGQHKEEIIRLLKSSAAGDGRTTELAPFALLSETERVLFDDEIDDAYPLSALQAGMVFHTQLEQFSGIYHDIMANHVRCPWNRDCFEQALAACVAEHPILRTGFRLDGERPLQFVHRTMPLPLQVEDLRTLSAEAQDRHLVEWTEAHKRYVFDWQNGPLFQIHIFRRSEDSFEFVVSFHHSVLDGWSRAALTTTLYNRYEQLLAGQVVPAAPVDWTYREFIAQEQAVLADTAAKQHFAANLEDAAAQQLPRRRVAGERGQRYRGVDDFPALAPLLIACARNLGVPVQAILLAVLFKALATSSGLARAVTTVTQNGRPERAGGERALGLFLNSLPLGLELGQGSWRELVTRVAALNTAAMTWRGYPLARIQQDLGRGFSEVLFNYTHFHVYNDMAAADGQAIEVLGASGFEQTNFDLLVDVARGVDGEGMRLSMFYDSGVFDESTIGDLSDYFVAACRALLADIDASHTPSLLSPAQLQQLQQWSAPQGEYEDGRCIHEWFEAQVARDPAAIALSYEAQSLTYAELESRANRLAHALRAQGVGPDQRVGLCVERSLDMVVGILGILKAGGGYVPLDPAYPAERLAYLVADSAPQVIVTQRGLEDRLPAGANCWWLDSDVSSYPDTALPVAELGLKPEHLAYMIYTSGSTGQPKGVLVSHRNVQRLLSATESQFGFGPSDVWTLFHSYAFDFTVWELWGSLAYGGRLVVVPHWVARSPEDFHALLQREQVTVLNQTPTAFMQLAHVDAQRGGELALRAVVFGGEALNLGELKGWVARHGDERPQLINMYGITETTVHVTYRRIRQAEIEGNSGSVIGRALADLSVYVLDANRQLVAPGTPGEMYVGGGGVSRGYLNRPELSAERFVDNPFGAGKLYRTGDLARYLTDGDLEYLGRIDAQVKIRGFRIELGEIEQQLSALPGVQASVVLAREDLPGHKRLVAYVVPTTAGDAAEQIAGYRAALGQRLPDYMVPSAFVLMDVLPLTPNGKVDRKALPAPDTETATVAYVAPRNAVEQALAEVWQEVLRRERVGIADNFFSLGGDSILSIRIVSLLKARGLQLAIKDLFQYQNIELLAPQVETVSAQREVLAPFALLSEAERALFGDGIEDAYPLSALQAGMVFHTQLEQFSGLYHDIVGQHVRCPWDPLCFEQALAACVEEHPLLRSGFRLDGERPLQFVRQAIELPLFVQDLRTLADEAQEQQLAEWTEAHKRHVFDWENGPLFQVHLFRRSEDSFHFVLSAHHAIIDGWSWAALTTSLYNRFRQLLAGGTLEPVLPNRAFRDFIALEQAALADPKAREHFLTQLEDLPAQQLPRMQDLRGNREAPAQRTVHTVDGMAALSTGLIELARRLGVPLQSVLLAGHFKVLSTLSGSSRAVSGVTHNGRPEQEGAEQALGLFLNSLPLAVDVHQCSWGELIARVTESALQSLAYRVYPLARIQQDTGQNFDEVSFNYTHFHAYDALAASADDELEVLSLSAFEQTNFNLLVDISRGIGVDALTVQLKYNAAALDTPWVERIGAYYHRAYAAMLQDLDAAHDAVALLGEDELVQLRDVRNATARPYPRACLHTQFEAQARRTPDAVAAVFGEVSLTYAQLDAKADCLARYLIEAGVAVESRVGLYLERSLELLIGVLGVLKAGGTYVPLEPGLPRERVAYMLDDAAIGWVLLTSAGLESLPVAGVDVVLMDQAGTDDGWFAEFADASTPAVEVSPDHLAYVLYTSGSTGQPKGVMITHVAASNYLNYAADNYLADDIAGAVVSSPLCFDATLTTLLPALLIGKPVVLLPDDETTLSTLSQRLFAPGEAWLFKITPAHLEALAYLERDTVQGVAAHRLIIGGEQLSVATLTPWKRDLLPNARFVNEYGPTETVVGCSVFEIATAEDLAALADSVAVPIGRPIQNTTLYVLGEGGQLQPTHSIGELYIGGAGLARGYLNRDALSAERFVANPFGEGKLYRTGDLVRWLPGDQLAFLGRRDDQVKIRGFRIELGEIESVLRSVADVRESIVIARNDGENGQARLVAYIVAQGESASLLERCRETLRARLPDYMLPAAFVVLDALPLTANGKVDRKGLPAPEADAGAVAYIAPRTAVEQALAEVWQEVLRRERIGIADNFFSLGGDSILSIRIVSLLKARGLQVAIKDLFQHQSIEQLAPQVQTSFSEAARLEPFALLSDTERALFGADIDDAYPLSALQAGMVFHTQLEQFSGIYHDIMADHLRCAWDRDCFEQALAACVAEHPILRTGFRLDGERPLQFVRSHGELPLFEQDLRALAADEQEAHLAAWTEQHKRRVFDWENGPLFQIHIFHRSADSFQFVISFHHSVLDGWSRAALTTALYNRYEQLLAGQVPALATVDHTYREFVAQEQAVLADPAAGAFFAANLEDAPAQQVPRRRMPAERGQGYRRVPDFWPLAAPLIACARNLGVPVQALLLAAHFKALATISGFPRAMTAVTQNGRPETAGGERAMGLFLNSLPLGLELGQGSWRELVGRVAAINTAAMAWRSYPLARIQQDLGRGFSEILFNYTHFHVYNDMAAAAPGEGGSGLEVLGSSGFEQTNFELLVDVARGLNGDDMRLAFVYDTGVFDESVIGDLSDYFVAACRALLADIDAAHTPSLLSPLQLQQLQQWSAPQGEYEDGRCIHEWFEAQVARDPAAIALSYEAQSLTYAELESRANRLAHALRARGVGPDQRVGLCVERSLDMVVGILGILKAGGGYVPLDPAYPAERLAYLVADSAPPVIVTQRGLEDRLPANANCWWLDSDLSSYPDTALPVAELGLKPEHLAYVIYTSGSTGRPKGVLVSHRNVQRLLSATEAQFGFGPTDVWTLFHSYAFDFTVWELWGSLAYGGRLVVVPHWVARSPEDFHALLQREQVTVLNQTPTAFMQLAQVDTQCGGELALRAVVFGGEALNLGELKGWVARHGDEQPQLINMYGITETTVHVTYRRIRQAEIEGNSGSVIGRALADLSVYVLDANRQLVAPGTPGEMYVGGGGVSRGYLNRPELSAECFVDNPFGAGKLYRTGDLARYLNDGDLEYLGRIDAQVKIRGFRIELGEIEQQLSALPGVQASVVLAREDEPGNKRLVAYVVPATSGDAADQIANYRQRLGERLPDYMLPSAFVLMEALPLTPNGKVDRRALPLPELITAAEHLAPQTETETAMAQIWASLLKIDARLVGRNANFFALGGHSLLLARLVTEIRTQFGIEIGMREVMELPSLDALAAAVFERTLRAHVAAAPNRTMREDEMEVTI